MTYNLLHLDIILHKYLTQHTLLHNIIELSQVPLQAVIYPFMKTPWQGAQTTIYCAVAEELEGISGGYFADRRDKGIMTQATTDEAIERLWELSCHRLVPRPSRFF